MRVVFGNKVLSLRMGEAAKAASSSVVSPLLRPILSRAVIARMKASRRCEYEVFLVGTRTRGQ